MRCPIATSAAKDARAGFSLLELSIVVAIISVVSVLGLELAANFAARKTIEASQSKVMDLADAIHSFYGVYGRLPCPAQRSLAPTNTSFGLEDCTITPFTATTILGGAIPFRTLNLPMSFAFDSYNSKIYYVVTQGLTVASTFAATGAAIEIRTGSLAQPCAGTCQVLADPAASPNTGAAYVIFSTGPDKRGATTRTGIVGQACAYGTGDTRPSSQNCTAITGGGALAAAVPVSVFYDNRFNAGSVPANFFDDLIVWRQKGQL